MVEFEGGLSDQGRVSIGIGKRAVLAELPVGRDRKIRIVLLERERCAGEERSRTHSLAAAVREFVELLGHLGRIADADVLVDLGKLLDLGLRALLAMLL